MALSLGPDVDQIADAGLITHDWTHEADGGMVSTSVVVFDVRPGNPHGIADWDDLTQPGVEILTPGPGFERRRPLEPRLGVGRRAPRLRRRQRGRRRPARRHCSQGVLGQRPRVRQERARLDPELRGRQRRRRDHLRERGHRRRRRPGSRTRRSTRRRACSSRTRSRVVDANVDKHCVREVAEAFVEFLHTDEVKELYTDVGFLRSTDLAEAKAGGGRLPADRGPVDRRGPRRAGTALTRGALQRHRDRHPGDRRADREDLVTDDGERRADARGRGTIARGLPRAPLPCFGTSRLRGAAILYLGLSWCSPWPRS